MFQFQTGSIRRSVDVPSRGEFCKGFQFQTGSIRSCKCCVAACYGFMQFQFQTGSIRSCNIARVLVANLSFNSKLVRLEGKNIVLLALLQALVSIPNWFDQKRCGVVQSGRLVLVSIPNWFDQKSRCENAPRGPGGVSIPNWFDQKYIVLIGHVLLNLFQFQTGSIRRF